MIGFHSVRYGLSLDNLRSPRNEVSSHNCEQRELNHTSNLFPFTIEVIAFSTMLLRTIGFSSTIVSNKVLDDIVQSHRRSSSVFMFSFQFLRGSIFILFLSPLKIRNKIRAFVKISNFGVARSYPSCRLALLYTFRFSYLDRIPIIFCMFVIHLHRRRVDFYIAI